MTFTALSITKNCPTDIHIRKTGFSITKKKTFRCVCVVKPIEANVKNISQAAEEAASLPGCAFFSFSGASKS
jgi:hypothetical protein